MSKVQRHYLSSIGLYVFQFKRSQCMQPCALPSHGLKHYWHNKGMFFHGGDESADISGIRDDNLIELLAYWMDKKKGHWLKHREDDIDTNAPLGPVIIIVSVRLLKVPERCVISIWWQSAGKRPVRKDAPDPRLNMSSDLVVAIHIQVSIAM